MKSSSSQTSSVGGEDKDLLASSENDPEDDGKGSSSAGDGEGEEGEAGRARETTKERGAIDEKDTDERNADSEAGPDE